MKNKKEKIKVCIIPIEVKDLHVFSLTREEIRRGIFVYKNKKFQRI